MTYDSQGCGLETRRSAAGHYDTGVVGPGAVGTPPQPAHFGPPLTDPIQFALERNDCDCDVCGRARAAAEQELAALKDALAMSEAHLSLLRYRATINWGTPGIPDVYEVDKTITASREALKIYDYSEEELQAMKDVGHA